MDFFDAVFDFVTVMGILIVLCVIAYQVWDIILSVQAKMMLCNIVRQSNDQILLGHAVDALNSKSLNHAEFTQARHRLKRYISKMPSTDARRVEKGLNQRNTQAAKRYLLEVIGVDPSMVRL